MMEYLSSHWEMLVIGRRAGAGGRPGICGRSSSMEISAISTNSRSRIRFTNQGGREAAGLYIPLGRRG